MQITVKSTTHRYEVLDSLRGICACVIVFYHLNTQGMLTNSGFVQNGFLFVDFFFVLSGFVIAASYGGRLSRGYSPTAFMLLRLGRIYPLHLAVLALFLVFEIVFAVAMPHSAGRPSFTDIYSVPLLVANLFLVQIFVGPDNGSWNAPAWSIAAEFWTYLVFAFVFRTAGRWLVPICLLVAAGSCIYLAFLTDRYLEVFHNGALARCLYGFSLGVIAHTVQSRVATLGDRTVVKGLWTFSEITAVGIVIAAVIFAGPSVYSLAIPPLLLVVILLFAQQAGGVSRILMQKPFLILGGLSYSIYMIHGFIELRFVNLLSGVGRVLHQPLVTSVKGHNEIGGSALFGDAMSILVLAITISCAAISYRWVEQPMHRRSRNWVASRFSRGSGFSPEAMAPST
ncbi:acyltransferase family protein [Sphingomonas echinoides]|uniref:acyltransferase family protein n=1 Tax=Sphingomonas echinoides TaxID=59803 RepID=UPI002412F8D6|nr:acyltransferase [Sphingomonas echinoides]